MFDRIALRRLRDKRDLSQEELGKRLGCRGDIISRYECGNTVPRTRRIIKLAKALGVPASELLNQPVSRSEQDAITERILAILDLLPESARAEALAHVAKVAETLRKAGAIPHAPGQGEKSRK